MDRFKVGDLVRARLRAGAALTSGSDIGEILSGYDLQPPAYEVRFRDETGLEYDQLVCEEDLEFAGDNDREDY
jgi:hypothetical protein